jgi:hypothetical protein
MLQPPAHLMAPSSVDWKTARPIIGDCGCRPEFGELRLVTSDALEEARWAVSWPGGRDLILPHKGNLADDGIPGFSPADELGFPEDRWRASSETWVADPLIAALTAEGEDIHIQDGVCHGTISGGQYNFIQSGADFGAIGGGSDNVVHPAAAWGVIPGGYQNEVAGECALAAGHRAKARHDGTFVWADNAPADFVSTARNQFLIRAAGGVGIGIHAPESQLHLAGGHGDLTRTEGDFKIGNQVARLKIGVALDGAQAGDVRLRAQGGTGRLMLGSGTSDAIRIDRERVGIERFPAANALEVNGAASKSTPGHWLANSDRRIKQDIQTVGQALETLRRVRLVRFRYSDTYRDAHPEVADRPYLDVVAQEFQEIFPDYVQSSGETVADSQQEILQVDTYPLTIYSAAAIQELHAIVAQKESEIGALQRAVAELTARLDALQRKEPPPTQADR